jgi:hypothetical protein
MESSNKDQTDDILREKLHALEIDAPLHVFDKVQQKRRKKYSAFWLFGSAATLLLALVVLLLFTEPNKVELPANLSPEVKKESSVIEEQNVLSHSNAVNALVEEKMKAKKSKPKLSKRNVDLVYLNKTPDQAIAEEENTLVPAKRIYSYSCKPNPRCTKALALIARNRFGHNSSRFLKGGCYPGQCQMKPNKQLNPIQHLSNCLQNLKKEMACRCSLHAKFI